MRRTNAENGQNRGKQSNGISSKYKGVTRNGNNFMAKIKANREDYYLGMFQTEKQAAYAYDEAAIKYHKAFAHLNFPRHKNVRKR